MESELVPYMARFHDSVKFKCSLMLKWYSSNQRKRSICYCSARERERSENMILVRLSLLVLQESSGNIKRSLQWKTDQVKVCVSNINQVNEYVSKNDQLRCVRIVVDRFFKLTLSLDRFFQSISASEPANTKKNVLLDFLKNDPLY